MRALLPEHGRQPDRWFQAPSAPNRTSARREGRRANPSHQVQAERSSARIADVADASSRRARGGSDRDDHSPDPATSAVRSHAPAPDRPQDIGNRETRCMTPFGLRQTLESPTSDESGARRGKASPKADAGSL